MNYPIRICLISSHLFGHCALEGILESDEYKKGLIECPLVLSHPSLKRKSIVGFKDFTEITLKNKISNILINSAKTDEAFDFIQELLPDFIFVIGWSELVPQKILDIPKIKHKGHLRHTSYYGCIGMHPTLLPQGRGRAPIPWTIINDLDETGVTVFLLEEAADAGGIILQEKIKIASNETATTLFRKCATKHFSLGKNLASIIAKRKLSWLDQDNKLATFWKKRRPEDGEIDFNTKVLEIDRFVRALADPYPSSFFLYQDKIISVKKINFYFEKDFPQYELTHPGTIVFISAQNKPVIRAKDGYIECLNIQTEEIIPQFLPFTMVQGYCEYVQVL